MGRKSEDSGRSRKTKSGGRNEKPRTDWRLAGSYVQSETGFANVIGGESGIRTRGRVLPYTRFPGVLFSLFNRPIDAALSEE